MGSAVGADGASVGMLQLDAEHLLQAAFEEAPIGIELTTDTEVVAVNARMEEITGRPRAELLPDGVMPFLHPDDRMKLIAEIEAHDALGEVAFEAEARLMRPDGEERRVRGTIVALAAAPLSRLVYIEDITDGLRRNERLEWQAFHDSLTGLPNRALVLDRIAHGLARARRHNEITAVLYLDLDRFKFVNDTLGHAAGDDLLRQVAVRLDDTVRDEDTVARLGGDEFVVYAELLSERADAEKLADRIADAIAAPMEMKDRALTITVSIGIAFDTGHDPETLLREADTALYFAKARGRDRYEIFHPAQAVQGATSSTSKPSPSSRYATSAPPAMG